MVQALQSVQSAVLMVHVIQTSTGILLSNWLGSMISLCDVELVSEVFTFLHNDERVSINSSDGECDFMVCQLVFQLALKKMKMHQNTAS